MIALIVVTVAALVLRQTTIGRQVYALGSNPEAAEILGIRTRLITISTFAVCGLLAGVAGVMWGLEFGTINATAATGVTLQVIAAVVVGGVNINGGSGTVIGAGIGALFLAFIQNALILLKLSQFWLQAIYGLVILIAVVLDGALLRAVQRSRARGRRAVRPPPARFLGWEALLAVVLVALIAIGGHGVAGVPVGPQLHEPHRRP